MTSWSLSTWASAAAIPQRSKIPRTTRCRASCASRRSFSIPGYSATFASLARRARLWIKKKPRVNDGEEGGMSSAFDLSGQRTLITGAAGGIGAATARVCASLGAGLVLVDRRPTEPLAAQLRESGTEAAAFDCDVTRRAEVEAGVPLSGPGGAR